MAKNDIRLLSLDGGGVRGLSSLLILRSIMCTIDAANPPKPCDYFDMIGGTSTGGLIAIMLGRLEMSVDECIAAYTSLADRVFRKKNRRIKANGKLQGRFSGEALENAVKEILVNTGNEEEALLKSESHKCRVFVSAAKKINSEIVCFTSYPTSSYLYPDTKIWEACRATAAATTFFDPLPIGPFGEEFVDGAFAANNPVAVVWDQAQAIWGRQLRSKLRCMISIGTGMPKLASLSDRAEPNVLALKVIALDTERAADSFRRDKSDLDEEGRYYRFNVVRGLETVGLHEAGKKADIAAATSQYVASQEVMGEMRRCANALTSRTYFGPYRTIFSLPGVPVTANFVDRPSEFLEISLLPSLCSRMGRKVVVIHGPGGSGKTQLALHFVQRHEASFSSVFWLDGRTEHHLRQSIASCIDRIPVDQVPELSGGPGGNETQEMEVSRVVSWLGRPDNRQWLVVVDGVVPESHQPELRGRLQRRQLDSFMSRYMPWDQGSVLVTTGAASLTQMAPPGYSRKLGGVDMALGKQILEAGLASEPVPDVEKLVQVLDGQPLALSLAASYLRETGSTIPTYLERFDAMRREPRCSNNMASTEAVIALSLTQVEKEDVCAANLVRLWAFLDHENLWYGLLQVADFKNAQWPTWLVDMASDESRFANAVQVLIRYSLINTQEGVPGCYSMQPTVHRWSRHREESSQIAEYDRLAAMVIGLSVSFGDTPECRTTRRMLAPHARLCAGWLKSLSTSMSEGVVEKSALYSIHGLAALLEDQGDVSAAQDMFELALKLAERSLGLEDATALSILQAFASLKQSLGETVAAEKMLLRVLSGSKILPPGDTTTLDTLQCLGLVYEDQDDLPKAEAMYRRALFGRERILGRHELSTLETVSCLGSLYRKQGRLDDAAGMYGQLLFGYGTALGVHHKLRLEAAEDLEQLLRAQGRTAAADELHLRVLSDTHPKLLRADRSEDREPQRKATSLSECKTLTAEGDGSPGEKDGVLKRVGSRLKLMFGKVPAG